MDIGTIILYVIGAALLILLGMTLGIKLCDCATHSKQNLIDAQKNLIKALYDGLTARDDYIATLKNRLDLQDKYIDLLKRSVRTNE